MDKLPAVGSRESHHDTPAVAADATVALLRARLDHLVAEPLKTQIVRETPPGRHSIVAFAPSTTLACGSCTVAMTGAVTICGGWPGWAW